MQNDTAHPLSEIRPSSIESLSSRVNRVKSKAELKEQKTAMRLCIQVDLNADDSPSGRTSPIELRHHNSDEYIAVSCPWSLSGHDLVSGHYKFVVEPPGIIVPPDVVLDRILNFKVCNSDYLHTPFWIDKLCINQKSSDEKEIAVHSMDLVYQYSGKKVVAGGQERWVGCSLGLLFVEIKTIAQLINLRGLLDSKFADNNNNEPKLLVSVEEALHVLELIEMIVEDSWWHRAWIFQEEFLASRHMVLLLPCTLDRTNLFETGLFDKENDVDLFGKTSGEIEVRPLNFRTEVTTFCLALSRHVDEDDKNRCFEILKYACRYTFMYRCKYEAGPRSAVHAMSPAIFEDISTRGITVPSDILAIAANCCRYVTRLNSQILNNTHESLSVAILTLFVMNGEILRHDVERNAILGHTVFECLRRAKLKIPSPVQAGELIFIKMCRLPTVTMKSTGLEVKGVLSRLDTKIKVKVSVSDEDLYWKNNDDNNTITLNEGERKLLLALAAHLETIRHQGGDALHTKLREFLKEQEKERHPQFWSQQHIQVMMAKGVCRAIVEGRQLWLSRLQAQTKQWTPWLGVLVPDDPFDDRTFSFAFTAAESDHELKDRGAKLARKNSRVTSLEVRWNPYRKEIVPRKWMNGLCFFNNKEHCRSFLIPWPKWMQ